MRKTRMAPSVLLGALLLLSACGAGADPPPITPVVFEDAISREIVVLPITSVTYDDANSREIVAVPITPLTYDDANSREIVAVPITPVTHDDATSREMMAYVGPVPAFIAKGLPTGRDVAIESSVVTASFPDFFYLESADRSSGVMVAWPDAIAEGSLVQVLGGTAITADSERYVQGTEVTASGSGSVGPLGIRPALLGGGDLLYTPGGATGQPGSQAWDWTASAVVDVSGLSNIGLLVTTWGKVTWVGESAFIIDDGSGLRFGDPTSPGVRVLLPPDVGVPEVDTWVSVTGISSCYRVDATIYRLLRVRKPADITPRATK